MRGGGGDAESDARIEPMGEFWFWELHILQSCLPTAPVYHIIIISVTILLLSESSESVIK
jgi:hypothetical protein